MRSFLAVWMMLASAAQAEAPKVLVDIAPVHSLVAQVMGSLGTPGLLISPLDDPHQFQLRPSQARLAREADLVIWVGEAMTPWLPRMIENLGSDSITLELLTLETVPQATVAHDGHDHDAHGHGDPHAWLDPQNGRLFLAAIAQALAQADPENAETYRTNAVTAQAQLAALDAEISAQLTPVLGVSLVSYHDAYRYFFNHFGLEFAGSLADSEATPPSAARLSEIKSLLTNTPRYCVFSEPGGNDMLIASVLPDSGAVVDVLDPIGVDLPPGPTLYPTLLWRMASTIADCQSR